MKINKTDKYLQRQHITCTKEGAKSSNSEINDFLTLTQLILYAKSRCPRS